MAPTHAVTSTQRNSAHAAPTQHPSAPVNFIYNEKESLFSRLQGAPLGRGNIAEFELAFGLQSTRRFLRVLD